MKRWMQIPVVLFVCAFFGGCNMTMFDTETLMTPPQPVGTVAEIRATLEAYTGTGFTLKYPRSGDYRSAIFMADMDSDGQKEAGAFYRPANESGGTHFAVMDYIDGQWKVVGDVTGPGVDVERISLTYFDSSKQLNLLIGWNMYSRDKIGTVYYYDGKQLVSSITEFSYTEMVVADLDHDGIQELFSMLLNTTDMTSVGKMHERNPLTGYMQTSAEIQMDGNISGYAKIQAGKLWNNRENCLIVDAHKGSTTMSTEVIYWNESIHRMQAVGRLFVDDLKLGTDPLLRESKVNCRDVDGDGMIDIPSPAACIRKIVVENEVDGEIVKSIVEEKQAESYVTWLHLYSYYEATPVAYSVHADGYYFLLNPETAAMWLQNYYFKHSVDETVLSFYDNKTNAEILRITSFSEADWEKTEKGTYIELLRNNGFVYAAEVIDERITPDELQYIASHFYLE